MQKFEYLEIYFDNLEKAIKYVKISYSFLIKNMKNLLNEIDIINKNNYEFVNFNYFLINDKKNTIKKIILVNLYKFIFG